MDTSTTHPGQIEDRRFWRKLRRAAGHFPLTTELVAGYYAMRATDTDRWLAAMSRLQQGMERP